LDIVEDESAAGYARCLEQTPDGRAKALDLCDHRVANPGRHRHEGRIRRHVDPSEHRSEHLDHVEGIAAGGFVEAVGASMILLRLLRHRIDERDGCAAIEGQEPDYVAESFALDHRGEARSGALFELERTRRRDDANLEARRAPREMMREL